MTMLPEQQDRDPREAPDPRPSLPNFLVIGSQRCGTTWLHRILREHPQVFLPEHKELHFFDWRMDDHGLDWYLEHFRQPEPAKPFAGEISPGYVTLNRQSVARVQRLLPNAKILLVVRNPVERAWSGAMYEMGTMLGRTAQGISVGRALRHINSPRNLRRTDYLRAIGNWTAAYGDERFKVVFYEDMQRDPAGYVREILAHIGADPDWDPPSGQIEERVNAADKLEMPAIARWYLTQKWRPSMIELNEQLDGRAAQWLEDVDSSPPGELSWRLRTTLNRLAVQPRNLAYRGHDQLRERRRRRRFRRVLADAARLGLLSAPPERA